MDWASPTGSGRGTAVSLTDDTGYFWFFDAANVEAVIKVLDACPLNTRFWVFAGGLTDVEVEMRVTDTATGEVVTYVNPQGTAFQPIQDTSAFDSCDALATSSGAESALVLSAPPSWSSAEVSGGGAPGGSPSLGVLERSSTATGTGTVLTLGGGRFEVRLDWRTGTASGQGAAEQLTSDTGYFWF
ncbi:MAG TPA: hypothetical protein VMM81_06815, partial [Acidimicrobiia bacterium]|nr:hypothetical protein [Acidimicrobiia bacterium]